MTANKIYRADSRPPADVFANGFHAWGTNINYNSHFNGSSGRRCTRDSAFIPTTSRRDAAIRFSTDVINVSDDSVAYIYIIRAANNFYSALDTIYNLYDASDIRVPDYYRAVLAEEQEYSAYQNISPQLIELVLIRQRVNGVIHETEERNSNYTPDSTHSNDSPFTYGMPYEINNRPALLMGRSITNANNEQPDGAAVLPSPSYTRGGLFGVNIIALNSEL